jgi:hypothetical protein
MFSDTFEICSGFSLQVVCSLLVWALAPAPRYERVAREWVRGRRFQIRLALAGLTRGALALLMR